MKKLFTVTAIGLALLTWHTSCTLQPKAPEAFTPIKVETPANKIRNLKLISRLKRICWMQYCMLRTIRRGIKRCLPNL